MVFVWCDVTCYFGLGLLVILLFCCFFTCFVCTAACVFRFVFVWIVGLDVSAFDLWFSWNWILVDFVPYLLFGCLLMFWLLICLDFLIRLLGVNLFVLPLCLCYCLWFCYFSGFAVLALLFDLFVIIDGLCVFALVVFVCSYVLLFSCLIDYCL